MVWTLQQLTNDGIVSAPLIKGAGNQSVGGNLFVSVYNGQQHFAYVDKNQNIQDAFWDGAQWQVQQINNNGNITTNGPPSGNAVFVSVYNGQQHFAYIDLNSNIQDAWYDGAHWHLQQINNPNGAPAILGEYVATNGPGAFGSLFVSVYNDQQHFSYIDIGGNIQDAWYDGGAQWHVQQINNNGVTKGPPAEPGGSSLVVSVYNNYQHFTYNDEFGSIWDASFGPAYFNGRNTGLFLWSLQQINNKTTNQYAFTNGPPLNGHLSVSVYNNQHHFTYSDPNFNIQDAWWDGAKGRWHLQQINGGNGATVAGEYIATPGPSAAVDAGPFVAVCNGQHHFAYMDGVGTIWDAFYDGAQWNLRQINNNGVTSGTPANKNYEYGNLFVSAYGTQQHFAYIDENNNVLDAFQS